MACTFRLFFLCLLCACQTAHAQAALELHKWSGKINVPDPVAVTVDPQGRVYVAATTRRKVADLDIREHRDWIPDDVTLDSVEAKRAFLQAALAPGKLRAPRGSLMDHNRDGSIDWKDLTVHSERIYQLRDEDGDGSADRLTVFAEGFNSEVTGIAAGVLWHDGWVYVTVAPDLWRLKDTDDDGVADVREVVAHGFGMHIAYAGHDMHGPRLGPDGRIYWTIGDKGVNVTSREGRSFYYPHEGCVLRVEPDGTGFEVFARGLRNVQEIAFDAHGNLFGVDNDADMTGEKERLVHLVEGSDAGWRCGHQYMALDSRWMREGLWQTAHADQPLFLLPPLALSRNGPAGFLWEPGTALNDRLRGRFFLNQFPSGELTALTLEPSGASFTQTEQVTLNQGLMGIGMAWGPEGALYLADWDGGYPLDEKGAVWRVDAASDRDPAVRQEVRQRLRGEFKAESIEELVSLLGHADQRVRLGAQLEMVKRAAWPPLQKVAADAEAPELARLHALWGLGIGLRRGALATPTVQALLKDPQPLLRAQACKVLGDAFAATTTANAGAGAALLPLVADPEASVRLQAALALGKARVATALPALLAMAAQDAADPTLRHAVAFALAGCGQPKELAAVASDASLWKRAAALLALRHHAAPEVAVFLHDSVPRLVDEAARAIHDDTGVSSAWPQLAAMADGHRLLSEMTRRRALNASFRLGGAAQAKRLLNVALDSAHPLALRLEALQHLTTWNQPPRLDRVDGMAHDLSQRDASGAEAEVAVRVDALLALDAGDLKPAAIAMLVALKVPVPAPTMAAIVTDPQAPDSVRAEALALMASQHHDQPELDTALSKVWEQRSPLILRQAALRAEASQRAARFPDRLREVLAAKTDVALKQEALALSIALPESARPAAAAVLLEWMRRLPAKGKKGVPAEWSLDLLEAAAALSPVSADLAQALAAHEGARPAPTISATGLPLLPLPPELLRGGDRTRGRDLVTQHLGANCLACHVVEASTGSNVGPVLAGIGKQQSREYLLEALLSPGAFIAPGYGTVSLTLKDGRSLAGVVLEESTTELTLRAADGTATVLARDQIASQTPAISVMPPMLGILSRREIRDVVEYLASLTKPPKKPAAGEH